jgi:Collagen triple helix repeat (20 copies)
MSEIDVTVPAQPGFIEVVTGFPGEQGPPGPPGPQGPDGPAGPSGQATLIIGTFGAQRTPADLPPDGFVPANWDGLGRPVADLQVEIGWSFIYDPDGSLWLYVGELSPSGQPWITPGVLQAPPGPPGLQGPPGPQGGIGPAGPQGARGEQGAQGPTGGAGSTGAQGPPGLQGPIGTQGQPGAQGPQGLQGPPGQDGSATIVIGQFGVSKDPSDLPAEVPTGFIPADWDRPGTPAYQMRIGEALFFHRDGHPVDGTLYVYISQVTTPGGWIDVGRIMGPQGDQGETGPEGPQGPQGLVGPTGPDGPQGPIGMGIQGPTGAQGPTGPQGDAGEQGIQGATGPQGPPGLDGEVTRAELLARPVGQPLSLAPGWQDGAFGPEDQPLRFFYHRGVASIGGYIQWTSAGVPPSGAVIGAIPLGYTLPTSIFLCPVLASQGGPLARLVAQVIIVQGYQLQLYTNPPQDWPGVTGVSYLFLDSIRLVPLSAVPGATTRRVLPVPAWARLPAS